MQTGLLEHKMERFGAKNSKFIENRKHLDVYLLCGSVSSSVRILNDGNDVRNQLQLE